MPALLILALCGTPAEFNAFAENTGKTWCCNCEPCECLDTPQGCQCMRTPNCRCSPRCKCAGCTCGLATVKAEPAVQPVALWCPDPDVLEYCIACEKAKAILGRKGVPYIIHLKRKGPWPRIMRGKWECDLSDRRFTMEEHIDALLKATAPKKEKPAEQSVPAERYYYPVQYVGSQ